MRQKQTICWNKERIKTMGSYVISVFVDTGCYRHIQISQIVAAPSRNGPCPCDSGRKYKNCCGKEKK